MVQASGVLTSVTGVKRPQWAVYDMARDVSSGCQSARLVVQVGAALAFTRDSE
jgi:hypothetical protein